MFRLLTVMTVCLLMSSIAQAQTFSYAFTGTVTDSIGFFGGTTGTVTGIDTFNLGAAIPSQSMGTVGNSSFDVTSSGGSAENEQAPASLVFTQSVTIEGITYQILGPNAYDVTSDIIGGPNYNSYEPYAVNQTSASAVHLTLYQVLIAEPAYTSDGLPITFSGGTGSVGGVGESYTSDSSGGGITYSIASFNAISPTPLPSSAYLFGSALLCLAGFAYRKERGETPIKNRLKWLKGVLQRSVQ